MIRKSFVCTWSTNMVGAEKQKLEISDSRSLKTPNPIKKTRSALDKKWFTCEDFISDKLIKISILSNLNLLKFQVGLKLNGGGGGGGDIKF